MRVFSVIVAVFTVIVLAVSGYVMATTQIGIEVEGVYGMPASEQFEAFEMARGWAQESNTSTITRYSQDVIGDVSNYHIVFLNVRLSNWDILPAEWLQINIHPAAGDILQIRQDSARMDGMQRKTVQAVLLTSNPNYYVHRDIDVEYYLFGRKFTATTVAEQA